MCPGCQSRIPRSAVRCRQSDWIPRHGRLAQVCVRRAVHAGNRAACKRRLRGWQPTGVKGCREHRGCQHRALQPAQRACQIRRRRLGAGGAGAAEVRGPFLSVAPPVGPAKPATSSDPQALQAHTQQSRHRYSERTSSPVSLATHTHSQPASMQAALTLQLAVGGPRGRPRPGPFWGRARRWLSKQPNSLLDTPFTPALGARSVPGPPPPAPDAHTNPAAARLRPPQGAVAPRAVVARRPARRLVVSAAQTQWDGEGRGAWARTRAWGLRLSPHMCMIARAILARSHARAPAHAAQPALLPSHLPLLSSLLSSLLPSLLSSLLSAQTTR